MLANHLAARFAQIALREISRVVICQRRSSSSIRAESTDNAGKRSKPGTSLRREKSTPASSSTGTNRAAGRPRSRTSTPRRPRAAARTHCPVFMCSSRIVIVATSAQCVLLKRRSSFAGQSAPPVTASALLRRSGSGPRWTGNKQGNFLQLCTFIVLICLVPPCRGRK
jgi:hypothetical protein